MLSLVWKLKQFGLFLYSLLFKNMFTIYLYLVQERIQKNLVGGVKVWLDWMLTKYKDGKPKKSVNKPFEKCFHNCGVFRIFFSEREHQISTYFQA